MSALALAEQIQTDEEFDWWSPSCLAIAKVYPEFFFQAYLRVPYLYTWQRQVCRQISERIVRGERRTEVLCRTAHGAGKTYFAAGLVLWFLFTRADSRVLTLAQGWAGVEDLLWPLIAELYNGSRMRDRKMGRLLTTKLTVAEGHYAIGASSDRPENLEGHHGASAAMRVVDEAKAVDPGVYESTEGMLTAPEAFDLWISTPSVEDGEFWKRDTSQDKSIVRAKVTVDDLIADYEAHPEYETLEGVSRWKANRLKPENWGSVDSPQYRTRALAEYATNLGQVLFPRAWVQKAFEYAPPMPIGDAPKAVGMDPAGSVDGDENAVAAGARPDEKFALLGVDSWHERDTMVSKDRGQNFARDHGCGLRVDSIGLGKGILDASMRDGFDTEEYRASDKPYDTEQFTNRKAEDAWSLRKKLEAGLADFSRVPEHFRSKLKDQMGAMKYEIVKSTGKTRVVDPDDSPDVADAVIIASSTARVGLMTADADWA